MRLLRQKRKNCSLFVPHFCKERLCIMLQFTDAHTFAVVDRPVDDRGLYDSYDPSHAFVSAALSGGLTVAITLLFGRSGLDLTGVVLFVVAWAAFAIVGSSLIQHDSPNNPPRWDRTDVAVVLAPQVLGLVCWVYLIIQALPAWPAASSVFSIILLGGGLLMQVSLGVTGYAGLAAARERWQLLQAPRIWCGTLMPHVDYSPQQYSRQYNTVCHCNPAVGAAMDNLLREYAETRDEALAYIQHPRTSKARIQRTEVDLAQLRQLVRQQLYAYICQHQPDD